MEASRRMKRLRFLRTLVFVLFGLFNTARAEAQLLAPTITVSPSTTNVSIGDTVTFTIVAHCNLGVLTSFSCVFSGNQLINGGALPTNAILNTVNGILDLDSTITNTLTIKNVSAACAGTYTVKYSDLLGLLGLSSSAPITLNILPTVSAITSGSGMVANGFQLQFSGPTGSNCVIQASSDLKTWVPISTNVITGGVVSYIDAAAKAHPTRFYRAKLQ
jgi:hypothetical protein